MKNIYLHIGAHKTGSTAIQAALKDLSAQNRLQEHDFCVAPQNIACYIMAIVYFKDKASKKFYFNLLQKSITQFLQEAHTQNVIFSFESLSIHTLLENTFIVDFFAHILAPHNVKILFYMRKQDNAWESFWSQSQKHFMYPVDFQVEHLHTKEILDMYAHYFGKENIHVRLYDKQTLYRENAICDFLEWVKLQKLIPFLRNPQYNYNPSLASQNLRIVLSYMRQNRLNEEEKKERVQEILENLPEHPGHTYFKMLDFVVSDNGIDSNMDFIRPLQTLFNLTNSEKSTHAYMSLDERTQYLEECREENEYIAKEYLGRKNGILFADKMPKETISLDSPNTDDLVKSFLPMLVYFKQELAELEEENRQYKVRIQELENINKRLKLDFQLYLRANLKNK